MISWFDLSFAPAHRRCGLPRFRSMSMILPNDILPVAFSIPSIRRELLTSRTLARLSERANQPFAQTKAPRASQGRSLRQSLG